MALNSVTNGFQSVFRVKYIVRHDIIEGRKNGVQRFSMSIQYYHT